MRNLLFVICAIWIPINCCGFNLFSKADDNYPLVIKEITMQYGEEPDSIFEFPISYKDFKYYMFDTPTQYEKVFYTYYVRSSRKKAFLTQSSVIDQVLSVSRMKDADTAIPLIESLLKSDLDYSWQSTTIDKGTFGASFSVRSLALVAKKNLIRKECTQISGKFEKTWTTFDDGQLRKVVDDWQLYAFGDTVPFNMKALICRQDTLPLVLVEMKGQKSLSCALIVQGKKPNFFLVGDTFDSFGYLKMLDELNTILPSDNNRMKLKCFSLLHQLIEVLMVNISGH